MDYVLYGAGVVACQTCAAVKELYQKEPGCFLVTEKESNPEVIDGIPVLAIAEFDVNEANVPVVVAAPEIYHEEIRKRLAGIPFTERYFLDTHKEYLLMRDYFRRKGKFILLEDLQLKTKPVGGAELFSFFMAKSHKDKQLKNTDVLPPEIIPVQAGSMTTDLVLEEKRDNTGDNISVKNPDYCELTVTYWAWKNQKNAYKGLYHYRRILLLDKADMERCLANNVDVVLPLPFVCWPTAAGQYRRYIKNEDMEYLKRALSEITPEYMPVLESLDSIPYFYNYNMLIAKEKVFNAYAEWLFDVLFCAEKYCAPNGLRHDRYAGYLGEVLTTIFFLKNMDKWKIAHGEKKWLV